MQTTGRSSVFSHNVLFPVSGEGEMSGNNYILTTWPYYLKEEEARLEVQSITADNDEAALAGAEKVIRSDAVGTLTAPDGRVVAKRYVIIHKADVGEGMRMRAGSWNFFAADENAANKILHKKTVDWMNILYGTDGVLARK